MRSHTLRYLAIATAVAVVLAVWALLPSGPARAGEELSERFFPGLQERINDAARLEVVQGGETVVLELRDGRWVLPEKGGYPAKAEEAVRILRALALAKPVEKRTANPAWHERLQLEDPSKEEAASRLVRVLDRDGQALAELVIGKSETAGGSRILYLVRRPDEDQAWLVEGNLRLPYSPRGWLDTTVVQIPRSEVQEVRVEHPDGEVVIVRRENEEQNDFQVQDLPEGWTLKYATVGNSLGNAFGTIQFDDVRPRGEHDFESAEVTRILCRTFDGRELRAELADFDSEVWARFDSEAEDLAAGTSDWEYQLQLFKANALRKRLKDLADPPAEEVGGEEEADAPEAEGGAASEAAEGGAGASEAAAEAGEAEAGEPVAEGGGDGGAAAGAGAAGASEEPSAAGGEPGTGDPGAEEPGASPPPGGQAGGR